MQTKIDMYGENAKGAEIKNVLESAIAKYAEKLVKQEAAVRGDADETLSGDIIEERSERVKADAQLSNDIYNALLRLSDIYYHERVIELSSLEDANVAGWYNEPDIELNTLFFIGNDTDAECTEFRSHDDYYTPLSSPIPAGADRLCIFIRKASGGAEPVNGWVYVLDDERVAKDIESLKSSVSSLRATLETANNKISAETAARQTADETLEKRIEVVEQSASGDKIVIDSELSPTSENPVQNKVVKVELDEKVDKVDLYGNTIVTHECEAEIYFDTTASLSYPSTVTTEVVKIDFSGVITDYVFNVDDGEAIIPTSFEYTAEATTSGIYYLRLCFDETKGNAFVSLSTTSIGDENNDATYENGIWIFEIGYLDILLESSEDAWDVSVTSFDFYGTSPYTKVATGRGVRSIRQLNHSTKNFLDAMNYLLDGSSITVDSELSNTSTNPVQNKVVKEALETTKINMDSVVMGIESRLLAELDKKYEASETVSDFLGSLSQPGGDDTTLFAMGGDFTVANFFADYVEFEEVNGFYDINGITQAILDLQKNGGTDKRTATIVIGTSTSGHSLINVDYLCDGTADQTEINNAIAALPESGGKIVLLEGTYNISGAINVNKDNVTIEGMGNGTILKRMFNGNTVYITANKCEVSNICIDGNYTAYAGSSNHEITLIDNASYCLIANNYIYNSYEGIYVAGGAMYNKIVVNHIVDAVSKGIILYNAKKNTVIDNTVINAGMGIAFDWYSENTVCKGNTCENSTTAGIHLQGNSTRNVISDNVVIKGDDTQYSIYLKSGYNIVANNQIPNMDYTNDGGTTNIFDNNMA